MRINTPERNGNSFPGDRKRKTRLMVFIIIFSISALAVLAQYAKAMLFSSSAVGATARTFAERGPILDRNGKILALQTRLGNVTLWRPEVDDPAATARTLGVLLSLDPVELEGRIRSSASDFIYVKKRVDQSEIAAVEAARAKGELRGAGIEPVMGRVYPEKSLAGPLIGFVGDDNNGLAGLEYEYKDELSPQKGTGSMAYGDQLFLTIDANAQHILEDITRRSMEENSAEAAMSIVLDPRNGEVLAYASLPDFDPNDIRSSTELSRLDRASVWPYEPGSVFKVFSMASLMELEGINENSTFTCDGSYERTTPSGERIMIKCLGAHGTVGPLEIIKYSCNAGAAYASDRVEVEAFAAMLKAFGFGEKTGIGLPGESPGFINQTDRWSLRSKQTIAIGQELSVSAWQMVQAMTAIANDGVMVRPHVVSRIVGPDGTLKKTLEAEAIRRVISSDNARKMRSYMAEAASEAGTGRRANVEDLRIAVKTGTAQMYDSEKKTYSATDFVASCIAMVPADEPKLIIYHVIVRPKGDSYLGGRIAAPPVREAAEALVDYFGIPRGRNEVAVHTGTLSISPNSLVTIGNEMPDLTGVAKKGLLPLLSREDLRMEIVGDGWVKTQSPAPGTPIRRGDTIHLELE